MSVDVAVIGLGVHPFGRHEASGSEMAAFAIREALCDAGLKWRDLQFAFGGSIGSGPYVGVPSTETPDSVVSRVGLTGLPFVNVTNGCATAGSALAAAANTIRSGEFSLGLVVGFDKHSRGHFNLDPAWAGLPRWYGEVGMMVTPQFFAMRIQRYMHDHGISVATLAKVAAKASRNGALNPKAWRRRPFNEDEILGSRMVCHPLTQYMFCSPNEGAAAMVLCRSDDASRYTNQPVYLRAACVRTREVGSFDVFSPWIGPSGTSSPVVSASRACYEAAGIGPDEVEIAQLQDSDSGSEIIHMAETGLCADGEQERLVQADETEIRGRMPINTDGGLIANGEPVGASGMRQAYETVLQLRGGAGARQVPGDPRVGFTQVYGAPGVAACTIFTR